MCLIWVIKRNMGYLFILITKCLETRTNQMEDNYE